MRYFLIFFTSLIVLMYGCGGEKKDQDPRDKLDERTKVRLRQYMAEGERLYTLHCSNCHQPEGIGLARLYPPLKGSDYLKKNTQDVICGIKYGQSGEIYVNGIMFDQEMPANLLLTDLEIAEISTYVYNQFADSVVIITLNDVRKILEKCDKDTVKTTVSGPKL